MQKTPQVVHGSVLPHPRRRQEKNLRANETPGSDRDDMEVHRHGPSITGVQDISNIIPTDHIGDWGVGSIKMYPNSADVSTQ